MTESTNEANRHVPSSSEPLHHLLEAMARPSKQDPTYTFDCSVFKANADHSNSDEDICNEKRTESCHGDSKKEDSSTNSGEKGNRDDDLLAFATLAVEPKFIHQCGSVGHVINICIRREREGGGEEGGEKPSIQNRDKQRLQIIQSLLDCVHEKARSMGCYKCLIDADESLAKELKTLDAYKIKGVQMCMELRLHSLSGGGRNNSTSTNSSFKTTSAGGLTIEEKGSSTSVTTISKGREETDVAEEDEKKNNNKKKKSVTSPNCSFASASTTSVTSALVPLMKRELTFCSRRITLDDFNKGFLELLAQLTVVGAISPQAFGDQLKAIEHRVGQYSLVVKHPKFGRIVATATLLVLRHNVTSRRYKRASSELKTKDTVPEDDDNDDGGKRRSSLETNDDDDNDENRNDEDHIDQEEIFNVGHIEDVVVDRQIRGQGLGKFILATILSLAVEKKCRYCVLNCDRKNIPFYEKCGFQENLIGMAHYF